MQTSTLRPRIQLIALMAAWFLWMIAIGSFLSGQAQLIWTGETPLLVVAVIGLITLAAFLLVDSRIPELAFLARLWPVRCIGLSALLGALGFWAGTSPNFGQSIESMLCLAV